MGKLPVFTEWTGEQLCGLCRGTAVLILQRPQHRQPQKCQDAHLRVKEAVGRGCLSPGFFDCHSFSWRSGFLWDAVEDVLEQRTISRAKLVKSSPSQPVPFALVTTTFPARSRGTHCDLSAAAVISLLLVLCSELGRGRGVGSVSVHLNCGRMLQDVYSFGYIWNFLDFS